MEIQIIDYECYLYAVRRGFEPLIDERFSMPIKLRRDIIVSKFGYKNTIDNNLLFYKWMWEHKKHYCEECLKPLYNYSSVYISHIITKGSHPILAYDPRNINILCFEHHNQWEHANTRKGMRIYQENLEKIKVLKRDSLKLQK